MATIEREVTYLCSDDCAPSGCPGHKGKLTHQSTADSYTFNMNGRELHFERGELDAMIYLLSQLGRVDCAQVAPNALVSGVTTSSKSTLESCPFCGCDMTIRSDRDWHNLSGNHDEACPFDGYPEPTMTVPATYEQLAALLRDWNRRNNEK